MNQLYKVFGLLALVLGVTHICIGKSESQLRLGKAVNIFIRYGYLSISMKVISYNDTETWLFKEPTVNIFKVNQQKKKVQIFENLNKLFCFSK